MAKDRREPPIGGDQSRNLRLILEYDGRFFSGWQVQPGQRTVQGAVEEALAIVLGHPVRVRVAGRTDAGVHAWGQVANFQTEVEISLQRLASGINGLAGEGVRVVRVDECSPDFDAQRSSRSKHYVYRILNRQQESPLLAGRTWHLRRDLDCEAMEFELASLVGEADWSAFQASDCGSKSPVKTLYAAGLEREARSVLALHFVGSGFLKHMVRALVGTVVEVGQGKRVRGSMLRLRDGGDRNQAGKTAPAHGLYLESVDFGEEAR